MTNTERRKFIKNCGTDFISSLCECIRNLLKANVPVSARQLETLRRHKQLLRKLSLRKTSMKVRRRILQRGGFVGFLIGPLITAITQLLASAVTSRHQ